jgi:hypothetical protein
MALVLELESELLHSEQDCRVLELVIHKYNEYPEGKKKKRKLVFFQYKINVPLWEIWS